MATSQKQISREAELRFAAEFAKEGWDIFLPFGEDSPIDLLIHKDREFMKVQIKATKIKEGALICKLRSTNNWQDKRYQKEEIDLFGFYDHENKKGYLIKFKEIQNKAEIKLRVIPSKNKQTKGVRLAKNYLFFQ